MLSYCLHMAHICGCTTYDTYTHLYIYHSFAEELPLAEHLASLPNKERVGALASISTCNTKAHQCHVSSDSTPLNTNSNIPQSWWQLQSEALMAHNTLSISLSMV